VAANPLDTALITLCLAIGSAFAASLRSSSGRLLMVLPGIVLACVLIGWFRREWTKGA
jgi:hypothetical protein